MATAEEIKIRITAQDSASQVINKTNREMQTLSRTATSTGVTTTRFGGNLSTMGRTAGQAGIQVQQLVGQIQGGTNPMLALSQQAADLGFVLGVPLLGAIAGLAASLAMNLVPALFETAKSTKDLSKEIDELLARTGSLTEAQKALLQQNRAKAAEEERKNVARLRAEIEANQRAVVALRKAQEDAELDPEAVGIIDYNAKVNELQEKRVTIVGELSNAEQRLRLIESGRTAEGDKFVLSLQKQVDLLGKTKAETLAYEAALLDLNPEQKKQVEALLQQIQVQEAANNLTKASKSDLDKLAESTRITNDQIEDYAASGLKKMEDGLIGLIDGSKSASDAFKSMANSIISDLIRMQIRKTITAPLAGLLDQSIGSLDFGSFLPSFAGGGYTGSGARTGGMDDRGGFPAILHPNETVIDHTKGGSGGGTIINQTIQVSTGVQQTVRAEIANMMPQIANATKQAVASARMRGGSFSAAMGA